MLPYVVQNGPIQKLPHISPKLGGRSRTLLDNVQKKDAFMAFLSHSFNHDGACKTSLGMLIISVDFMVRQLKLL